MGSPLSDDITFHLETMVEGPRGMTPDEIAAFLAFGQPPGGDAVGAGTATEPPPDDQPGAAGGMTDEEVVAFLNGGAPPLTAAADHWKSQPRDPGGEHGGEWVDNPVAGMTREMFDRLRNFTDIARAADGSHRLVKRGDLAVVIDRTGEKTEFSGDDVGAVAEAFPDVEWELTDVAARSLGTDVRTPSPPEPESPKPIETDDYPQITHAEALKIFARTWSAGDSYLVGRFTDDLYIDLNDYLRGGGDGEDAPPPWEPYDRKIAQLKKLMRPSPRALTLLRGTGLAELGVARHEDLRGLIGRRGTTRGFSSTSVTTGFGEHGTGVLLHIQAPRGTPMVYVAPVSTNPHEDEMLLPPGMRYEVITVREPDPGRKQWHVTLRVVNE